MHSLFQGYTVGEQELRQVQEQLDFRYYVSAYQTGVGTWKDVTLMERLSDIPGGHTLGHLDISEQKFGDCNSHLCVSVPGQSEWLQASNVQSRVHKSAVTASSPGKGKRARESVENKELDITTVAANITSSKHRRYTHEQIDSTAEEAPAANLQLGRGRGCIVNVYSLDIDLRLHDVIEVIGVYDCAPDLAALHFRSMTLDESHELNACHPPTSQVTRLHAISVKKVTPFDLCHKAPSLGADELQARAKHLRARAVDVLAAPLGGDKLAAEYLLLQLVSRVYKRIASQPLGTLSLNLFTAADAAPPATSADNAATAGGGASPEAAAGSSTPSKVCLSQWGEAVKAAVASLVPACVGLPLTIATLNERLLQPHKDDNELLVPTPLQLAPHTQLLLDETEMQQGHLTEIGCGNIEILEKLMASQQVHYDFDQYALPMKVDVPVTVLSVGASLLKASVDLEVPINAAGMLPQSTAVCDKSLPEVRAYLHQVQHLDFQMDAANWLPQEFVDARHQDQNLTASDFSRQLTLARLMAVSWAETNLTRDRWHQMKALEHARHSRLNAVRPDRSVQSVNRIISAVCG